METLSKSGNPAVQVWAHVRCVRQGYDQVRRLLLHYQQVCSRQNAQVCTKYVPLKNYVKINGKR